jgi:hypothetical protein
MKQLYLFILASLYAMAGQAQTLGYIQNVQHQAVRMDTMDGRKLLIVLLPTQPDTNTAGQILRFQARHGQQIRIIGVLAPGTGALVGANSSNAYSLLSAGGILLTEGMAATDSVGGPRSGLLQYLSRKNSNRQTDPNVEGGKYFISETGRLFGMLDRKGSLDYPVADYLVQTTVPAGNRF